MKEMKIKERKDGRFEARITVDGKQKSIYGDSVSEVKRKKRELQNDIANGININSSVRLGDAMQSYLYDIKQSRVKAGTFDRDESVFKNHIKDGIGRKTIGTVKPSDIQKLLLEKSQSGLSRSSVKKIHDLLGEFFRYAIATKEINVNPMTLVKMPHRSKSVHEVQELEIMTVDEVKRVITAAESVDEIGQASYRYGEAVILLLLTGLRSGEIRAIKKSDIDFDSRTLTISQSIAYVKDRVNGGKQHIIGDTKTEKSNRKIPLSDRALLAIERMLGSTYNADTGCLICTSKGQIVTHSNLLRCYNAILAKANVTRKGLHATRHTFATMLLKEAEDKGQIKEVSELLGHTQIATTYKYYIKTSNEDKRNLVSGLDRLAIAN